ncbi:unnamed protein product [Chilo suppressalis]|uniref:Uncharacterized protein n=1 Tax=Chilo suppressalis TaxID=168631 RepID=A0ABN8EE82_CHISP|nr:unnamed protein product [Chilo suppressalis]
MATKSTDWRPGPTVCRCCLSEGCYKDISTEYFWMGKREVYAEMLLNSFNLTISYSQSGGPNSNSRLICEPCISRLRDATDFKRQVQECEKTFTQYLDPGVSSISETEVPIDQLDSQVKVEQVKVEKMASDDDDFDDRTGFDDDDDDDLDDQPLTKLASKVPKKESVDILDLLDNAKAALKRKSSTKTKSAPAKKSKTTKKEAKPTSSSSKTVKIEKKKKGSDNNLKWNPKRKYNDHRDNAAIILEYSNAFPFRWKRGSFICGYCQLAFGDLSAVRDHSKEHCNKSEAVRFSKRGDNIKIDITGLRCELCSEKMVDINALKEHLLTVHNKPFVPKHDLGVTPFLTDNNDFLCTHCNERFEVFTKVNTHMNKHYQNNICYECGKSFSAPSRLKAHLAIHASTTKEQPKCTKCDKVFSTKIQKYSHIALVHGPEYRYRCPFCKDSFKSYLLRSKHLNEAHDRKVEYQCHLCPAVFTMFNQRTRHIEQVHLKVKKFFCVLCPAQFGTAAQLKNHVVKHTGERNFHCEVCKKSYPRQKTLKEHMRIHNNDKRFVCEYCNHAFVQKCSLKSHLRAHHPNAESLKKEDINVI